MPPIDTSQLETDLTNMIVDLPATMTYAGAIYSVIFTDFQAGHTLEPGGELDEFSASVYAKQSDFVIQPVAGVTVGLVGEVYRVDRTSKSPDGIGIRLDLITPDK